MNTTVSVIIPTYNRRALLKRAVESVLEQSYRDFELIVVDDGSTDGSAALVEGLGGAPRCLRQDHRGQAAARNRGIAEARGPLIAFLDSDDWWDREKLSVQVTAMENEPRYGVSHTQEIWYRGGEILPQKAKHRKYGGWIFERCLPLCAVSPSTAIVRKSLFDTVGLFDESFPCCEDYDLWLRASARHPFLLVDRALTLKEGGRPDQVSRIHRVGIDRFRIKALVKVLEEPGLLSDAQRSLAVRELEKKCRIYGNGCIKYGRAGEGRYYLGLMNNQ